MSHGYQRHYRQKEEGMPLRSHSVDDDDEEGTPLTLVQVYNHPNDRARRRKICFCIVSVASLGVFVAGVLAWSKKRKSAAKSLQLAPSDIHKKCSAAAVSHVDGYVICEEICQVALCCSAHEWDPSYCRDGNEEACQGYAPCYILDVIEDDDDVDDDDDIDDDYLEDDDDEEGINDGAENGDIDNGDGVGNDNGTISWTEVPPASPELAIKCDADSLSSVEGFSECEESCQRAECCWTSADHNCYFTFSECYHYSPCLVLLEEEYKKNDDGNATWTEVPPASPELARVCGAHIQSSAEGFSECNELCQRAECCWTSADHNCYFAFSECYHYSPCLVLLEEENKKDDDIAAALAVMNEICNAEKISNINGRKACEDACRPGQCCHAKGNDSCSESRDCADFEPCKILN
mmetsp:Transcript_31234/g.93605  ORF Transcript_31234/g.93605 Transcript_31234/m.93605 type:complete len:407 (-) Transcript_31234:27-1247(-)